MGQSKHSNHDAHYALVKPDPTDPTYSSYLPCTALPNHYSYDELVIFESTQVLPLFHITLQPSLPTQPATPSAILLQLAAAALVPIPPTSAALQPSASPSTSLTPKQIAENDLKRAQAYTATGLHDRAKPFYEKAQSAFAQLMDTVTSDTDMLEFAQILKKIQDVLQPAQSSSPVLLVSPSSPSSPKSAPAIPAITPAPAALSAPPTKAPAAAVTAQTTPHTPSSISTQLRQLLGPNLTDATDLARLLPPHILPPIPPTAIPPLPNGLETFLTSPCPLHKGQGLKYGFPTNDPLVAQTHTVFLLPPLSICDWQRILDTKTHTSPHKEAKFYSGSTTFFTQPNEQQKWSNTKPTPQWIIMPKMFIPDSHSKTFADQQKMIPPTYTLPTATQLVAQICLHFLQTGEKLYGDNYKKYTKDSKYLPYARTQDMTAAGYRAGVGCFAASGLCVNFARDDDGNDYIGVGAVLRYS